MPARKGATAAPPPMLPGPTPPGRGAMAGGAAPLIPTALGAPLAAAPEAATEGTLVLLMCANACFFFTLRKLRTRHASPRFNPKRPPPPLLPVLLLPLLFETRSEEELRLDVDGMMVCKEGGC